MACWVRSAGTKSTGASPWAYHSAVKPASAAAKPCQAVGDLRGAGRRNPLVAASGPRNRSSSFDTSAAVMCRSSQASAAEERSEVARPMPTVPNCGAPSAAFRSASDVPRSATTSADRATATCPANGTAGSQRLDSVPGSSADPASAAISITTGVSVFCASFALREAAVTARHSAAAMAATPT